MLSEAPVDVVLLSQDLAGKSKRFYTEKLGLSIIEEDESAISYRCGETRLKVTASTTGTKDEQTQASWRVIDVHAEARPGLTLVLGGHVGGTAREVPDVPDRGLDHVVLTQVRRNLLGLGG